MKISIKYVVSFLIFFFALPSFAAWEGGEKAISSLKFGEAGVLIKFLPRPAGCEEDVYSMHAILKTDNPYYKEMVGALLSAYSANLPVVDIWYTDNGRCDEDNYEYLELYQFRLKDK